MPELPDVELFKRYAEATALQKEIDKVRLTDDAPLEAVSDSSCRRKLTGAGSLDYRKMDSREPDYWKCAFKFTNSCLLYYVDPRKECTALSETQINAYVTACRTIMEQAVAPAAGPDKMADSFLLPRRSEGVDCPRCGGKVEK